MSFSHLMAGLAAGLLLSLAPLPAEAQNETEESTAELDRFAVTGSRIRRVEIEDVSPVTVITGEEMRAEGIQSTTDLFQRIPQLGFGSFTEQGDINDDTGPGTSGIALRGLSANATLVLLNGRRVANSPFAKEITTSTVDLNTIPFAAIDRIEILRDGASAIYGTDAIAGVVNIILRDDLQGGELHVTAGTSFEGDSEEYRASLMFGDQTGDTRFMATLDWMRIEELGFADRPFSATADRSQVHPDGLDLRSSLGSNPGAFFLLDSAEFIADPACPEDRLASGGALCLFDFAPDMVLRPESRRTSLVSSLEHDLDNRTTAYAEFLANHRRGLISGAASPTVDELFVSSEHPGNPFGEDVRARFRFTEVGPRVQRDNHTVLRGVLGIRGLFPNTVDWDYDISAALTRHSAGQDGIGGFVNINDAQAALDDFSLNIFGGATNPQEVLDRIETQTTRTGVSRQFVFDAGVSGQAGQLAGGPVGLAFGFQYRDESVRDTPDFQFREGFIVGTEATQAAGERDVNSFYAESILPLHETFELQLAARTDDYSDFGRTTNPRIGALYQPTDTVRLRASYSEGFRAPSLPEIGLGATEESPPLVDSTRCPLTGDEQDCGATERIVQFSGNPNLDPETSESINIGVIFQPHDWWSVSLDYWRIEHENLIASDTQFIVDNEDQFPDRVVRLEPTAEEAAQGIPGRIDFIRDTFLNFGSQETDGFDVDLVFNFNDFYGGMLRWQTAASYVNSFERQLREGQPVQRLEGTHQRPQLRLTSSADWTFADWGVGATVRHVDSYTEENNPFGIPIPRRVGSFTVFDVRGFYEPMSGTRLFGSIHNLFDRDPPFVSASFFGFDNRNHDPRGAFISVGLSHEF